ncbi:MAG: M15 family metallopeptidase, partial [Sinomicrobium sp.]|nr:M15 family metallopeptidase [Sinomicrobium sp.]
KTEMKLKYLYLILMLIAVSCKEKTAGRQPLTVAQERDTVSRESAPEPAVPYTGFESSLLDAGLKDIRQLDSTIRIALKYATEDNFMGRVLYTDLSHAFLQAEAATKLVAAQKELKEKDSALGLLVYDAVRPNSIQYKMWDLVAGTPKELYVAPPGSGSLHNFGCAVDLTIVKNGVPLDMGTPYDFFGKKAQPRYNRYFLDRNELTQEQVANRELLRTVMRSAGFIPIDSEWWHFNAFSLEDAKKKYNIVK